MSHPNAALTPRHRLIVAQLVVDQGWPISEVAARFQVSWPTVKRWADRYRTGQSMHVLRQGSCRISGFESDHTVGVWLTRE